MQQRIIISDMAVHKVVTIYYQVCAALLRSCYLTAYFYSISLNSPIYFTVSVEVSSPVEALIGPL